LTIASTPLALVLKELKKFFSFFFVMRKTIRSIEQDN
jgi:hypothetical protein